CPRGPRRSRRTAGPPAERRPGSMERTVRRDEPVSVQAVPAASLPHAERAALWTEAFSDYYAPGVVTAEALQGLERAFDLDTGASRLVLEDARPVAFAMLGIRGRRGRSEEHTSELQSH